MAFNYKRSPPDAQRAEGNTMSPSIQRGGRTFLALAALSLCAHAPAVGAATDSGARLERFEYPYPVSFFALKSQGTMLEMGYMDVQPAASNGRVVVLLHGKNFCSATWVDTIKPLVKDGYRVIAIDQVGFCKSSKPANYHYSFQQLAANTRDLLHSLGLSKVILVGHSTGGMLAIRYALGYPGDIDRLVLVSPIGLEDWKAAGVPWQSVDEWYARERATSVDTVRTYEQSTYYGGTWQARYDRWVDMYAGMFEGTHRDSAAWTSAMLYDMIYTQPVVYELGALKPKTLLISGDKDTTAIGKEQAPPEIRARLGHYPELAEQAASRIPNAELVRFSDLGHASFIQDPDRFNSVLLNHLDAPKP